MEERVGLKEVLAALDEFANDQRAFGDQLSELEATVRSVNGSLSALEPLNNDTLAGLARVDRQYAEIKQLVIRVFNL